MRELKASDKIAQEMTKNGLVEENLATGEVTNISSREAETEYAAHKEDSTAPKAVKRAAIEHRRVRSKQPVKQDVKSEPKSSNKKVISERSPENPSHRAWRTSGTPEPGKHTADKPAMSKSALKGSSKISKAQPAPKTPTGNSKSHLSFTSKEKQPNGRLRHDLLARPSAAVRAAGHQQVYEAEQDNVGVEAGHRGEILLEHGARRTEQAAFQRVRDHRMSRLQEGSPIEESATHIHSGSTVRKAKHNSPAQTGSNPVSRYIQKKRIQRNTVKQIRQTEQASKETATVTKTAAQRAKDAVKDAAAFVGRHHKGALILLGVGAVAFMLISGISSLSTVLSSSTGSIFSTSYLSEDADMLAAEAAYAGMEANLQDELDHYAERHPGYDEYIFDLDDIEHDPYVLISILSALHEGTFTLSDVHSDLNMLFEKQYILTEDVTTETRYRTETRTGTRTVTDPETGEESEEEYEYEVQAPYTYSICTVSLENFNLSHVPIYVMSEEQLSLYAGYMSTLGNREDLFAGTPGASSLREPTYYDIPPEALEDEQFAAMMAEATKYIGYPYVWGGSNPSTSFDCSGFVSWVLNQCGWNVGRLGADSLYYYCTPVSPANARPGDLVFFERTYDETGVTHVGIYVGNNMMLHCGNPIGYADLSGSYWQEHFFAFGRLP